MGSKHQSSKQLGTPTLKSALGSRQTTSDDVMYQGPDTTEDSPYYNVDGKKWINIAECLLVAVF